VEDGARPVGHWSSCSGGCAVKLLQELTGTNEFLRSGTHCRSANLVEIVLMLPVTSIQNAITHCAAVNMPAACCFFPQVTAPRLLWAPASIQC